ncbi:PASTA domain-containing protein [Nakamurella panacisegetis]|nr:PASTA domain-containing protein [Nakamurella panacisegetis]
MARGAVEVPDVVGLTFSGAVAIGRRAGFAVVGRTPDGSVVAVDSEGLVVEQDPLPGARGRAGQALTLRVGRGDGGSKDPEPRRPDPLVRSDFGDIDDPDPDMEMVPV